MTRRRTYFRPTLEHLEDRAVPAGPVSFAEPIDLGPGPDPVYIAWQEHNGTQEQNLGAHPNVASRARPVSNGVAAADLNGDSVPDLVSTNMLTDTVSVFLGLGGGAYGPAQNFAAGAAPSPLAVADFDGDGDQDVAVGNEPGVSLLLGDGRGGLGQPIPAAQGVIAAIALAVGRFDGGALPELAVADARGDQVTILKWNGLAGTFVNQAAFLTPRAADGQRMPISSMAAGAFQGDAGFQDLVVTGRSSAWVYFNHGASRFAHLWQEVSRR